ncbi:MAG: hypothetical protein AAGF12_37330 [Myxococcota bacterium]
MADSQLEKDVGPDGEVVWRSHRGTVRIRRPARDVVVFVEERYLDAGFAAIIDDACNEAVREAKRIHIFVDAFNLDGYVPEVRTGATEWLKRNKDHVIRQHMLVRSKITKMGLSVASLALGGVLMGHASRATFDNELRKCLRPGHAVRV